MVNRKWGGLLLLASVVLAALYFLALSPGRNSEAQERGRITKKYKKINIMGKYREQNWFFDIEDGNIRFSHGSHKNRNVWFRAYFRKNYECGICHNTSIPEDRDGEVKLSKGEPLNTLEDIRDFADEIYPYGVIMLTCLSSCHNGFTAPKKCEWCHLPGSKPLAEGLKEVPK